MAEGVPNIGDLFGALGGANPLNAIGKTIEQFRRAVDDLLGAVETFTTTMNTLNEVAGRVNRLMDDVEEPIRAVVPQMSATIRTAESMVNQLTGPIERVVPMIGAVSDALGAPAFARMPQQLGDFVDTLGEVTERLAPLTSMLESAGGLFRNNPLRSMLGALDVSPRPGAAEPQTVVAPPPPPPPRPVAKAATPKATKPAKAATSKATKPAAAARPAAPAKKAAAKQAAPANKAAAKQAAPAKKAAGSRR